MRRLATTLALLGLGLGLSSACSGDDDDDNDDNDAKCETFKQVVVDCYDSGCEGNSSAFCGCWQQQKDIDPQTCECAPLNLDALCVIVDLDNVNPAQYNCDAAMDVVGSFCQG